MAGHVAGHHPDIARPQLKSVIPVSANVASLCGRIAAREFNLRMSRQRRGKETPLQHASRNAFRYGHSRLQCTGNLVRHNLEQHRVVLIERSWVK